MFHVPSSLTTRSDPNGELEMGADVVPRQTIQDPFAVSQPLKLFCCEFGHYVVIADVDVELIA